VKNLVIASLIASSTVAAAAPTPKASTPKPSSVVAADPSFTLDDSYSLDKIAAAFEKVGPEVVYTIDGADVWATWSPAPTSPGSTFVHPNMFRKVGERECKEPGALAAYGAELETELYMGSVLIVDHLCKGPDYTHLPAGTPVVVWGENAAGWIVVVSLDGGRYEVQHPESLKHGAAGVQVPKASLHAYLGNSELGQLAPKDAAAKATYDALEKASRDYNRCAVPFFEKAEKQIRALPPLMADAPRAAKSAAINKQHAAQREKACNKFVTTYTTTLAKFLAERETKRRAIASTAARLVGP